MKHHLVVIGLAASILSFTGCPKPTLDSVQPGPVVPGQIVVVGGHDLGLATVYWNAGTASESIAKQSFLVSHYFQIPRDASPGVHHVQLENSVGRSSNIVDVTVKALSGNWPPPRIEDISIVGLEDLAGIGKPGKANVWLTVSAANVDADATVVVNGVVRTSVFYSAIASSYFNSQLPETYKYPVYHYGQLVAVLEDEPFGQTLSVEVTNADGQSDTRPYRLPPNLASLDSDNDGLLDAWETTGYPAPSGATISLKAFGCDPHRKDVLVEADWVSGANPKAEIWNEIKSVFANAPVLNPDGSQGIAIHIDRGQSPFNMGGEVLPFHTYLGFGPNPDPARYPDYENFSNYKSQHFLADRTRIFHYCVFGNLQPGNNSGRGEIWGNDFIVTFAAWSSWASLTAQVGTFVHELGHNLALHHGGVDNDAADSDVMGKPNQESSMNYRYQLSGVSLNCDFSSENVHTYSRGMFKPIDENAVDEKSGICDDASLDINCDAQITMGQMDGNVYLQTNGVVVHPDLYQDYNGDGRADGVIIMTMVLRNYDEWGHLKLNFVLGNWTTYGP